MILNERRIEEIINIEWNTCADCVLRSSQVHMGQNEWTKMEIFLNIYNI
jgi:hypothetical protein